MPQLVAPSSIFKAGNGRWNLSRRIPLALTALPPSSTAKGPVVTADLPRLASPSEGQLISILHRPPPGHRINAEVLGTRIGTSLGAVPPFSTVNSAQERLPCMGLVIFSLWLLEGGASITPLYRKLGLTGVNPPARGHWVGNAAKLGLRPQESLLLATMGGLSPLHGSPLPLETCSLWLFHI